MEHTPEFFGTPDQQTVQRRAANIWQLLRDDPDYSCHGRAVALSEFTPENLPQQLALARLQGVGACEGLTADTIADRRAALRAEGLQTDEFVSWAGGEQAVAAARAVCAARQLAPDLDLVSVDENTPADDLAQLDALTHSCGVLLPMGTFLRGRERPAVCLFARDRGGRIVATSASIAQFHPDSRKGDIAWWGMLATDEDRRGEGSALVMGALSLIAMHERYGFNRFFTGIRQDNLPSEKLCSKLGLRNNGNLVLLAIDPDVMSGGRLTK